MKEIKHIESVVNRERENALVVIDCSNISFREVDPALEWVKSQSCNPKIMAFVPYSDKCMRSWCPFLQERGIEIIPIPYYSKNKEASDLLLTLYSVQSLLDGMFGEYYLISSDTDFCHLGNFIRLNQDHLGRVKSVIIANPHRTNNSVFRAFDEVRFVGENTRSSTDRKRKKILPRGLAGAC